MLWYKVLLLIFANKRVKIFRMNLFSRALQKIMLRVY